MKLAPIVLFVYNRLRHAQETLEALEKNELADQSILYIYADGIKDSVNDEQKTKVDEVRRFIRSKTWCKETHIIERERNLGLADNIVDGVTTIVNKYGRVIVLEDDIITSPYFLTYMNEALELYAEEEKVMHVSGYMFPIKIKLPPTFFYNTASCWGWATWDRAWEYYRNDAGNMCMEILNKGLLNKFNVDGAYDFYKQLKANADRTLKTWAVRWYASFFLKNGFALHPFPSLTQNIGHDGSGTNTGKSQSFQWDGLPVKKIEVEPIPIKPSLDAIDGMKAFHGKTSRKISLVGSFYRILRRILPVKLKDKIVRKFIQRYEQQNGKKTSNSHLYPRYTQLYVPFHGRKLKVVDIASFEFINREVFIEEIYKFKGSSDEPYIIDAGANIGLGTLYFKMLYPNSKIVAFEPDPQVFDVLQENLGSFGYEDVELIPKALWDSETTLTFFQEGADGGRIATTQDREAITTLPTTRLRKYIEQPVDFLKVDIEGAETRVLQDCQDLLHNVERIFVEYHSFASEKQTLNELLEVLTAAGFRYYISHIGVYSPQPLLKKNTFLGMDNQLNIYATRET